jgi:hypothetical protein
MQNPTFGHRDEHAEQIRDEANAWVARFAPLVMEKAVWTEAEIAEALEVVEALENSGRELRTRLASVEKPEDQSLISTFDRALGLLPDLEKDFRKRLAKLAPGDPRGIADIEALNDRLAEREARKELGVDLHSAPAVLNLQTSKGNWASAGFMAIFGLGWNSFTAVHATFMIGGMYKAFGWAALGLLAFYAIFFTVGFGMLYGAWVSAANESVEIDGLRLTVTQQLGPIKKRRSYTMSKDSSAEVGETTQSIGFKARSQNSDAVKTTPCVNITDAEGSAIAIAMNASDLHRRRIAEQINAYIQAQS